MEKFSTLISTAVPLDISNVDTDQIIPARFLKATDKKGFGDNLFRDWRYNKQGDLIEDFALNKSKYSGSILVAGDNFGCGSSREHAAWALAGYGLKVIISSFFADIFKNNCLNIGVLPVTVTPAFAEKLFAAIAADPQTEVEVNLPQQTITLLATGDAESFDINEYKKDNMQHGFDDIDYLINMSAEIEGFEASR